MAENEGQEKTEEPTPKRLSEARRKGQVPRSRELSTVFVLMSAAGFFALFGGYFLIRLATDLAGAFSLERDMLFDPFVLREHLRGLMVSAVVQLLPLFLVLMVASFLGPLMIGGANFSAQAMAPKLNKLNPISGLKRIFSPNGLIELFKALAKFLVVATVAWFVLSSLQGELLSLGEEPILQALGHAGDIAVRTFLFVSAALILVALVDVPFQLWNHNKQLRMTRQEVRDEFKDTEGRPEVKGRIRRLQMEMAQRRMMAEVPKADVVITNPTHFAVALAYQSATMRAPRLLAKGADDVALAIRRVAEEHGIVRVEAPRVARAIYYTTELEEEIPSGLFVAAARILAYVYQLKRAPNEVRLPSELPVPDEYLDPRSAYQARFHR